jgi:hypothetical protein
MNLLTPPPGRALPPPIVGAPSSSGSARTVSLSKCMPGASWLRPRHDVSPPSLLLVAWKSYMTSSRTTTSIYMAARFTVSNVKSSMFYRRLDSFFCMRILKVFCSNNIKAVRCTSKRELFFYVWFFLCILGSSDLKVSFRFAKICFLFISDSFLIRSWGVLACKFCFDLLNIFLPLFCLVSLSILNSSGLALFFLFQYPKFSHRRFFRLFFYIDCITRRSACVWAMLCESCGVWELWVWESCDTWDQGCIRAVVCDSWGVQELRRVRAVCVRTVVYEICAVWEVWFVRAWCENYGVCELWYVRAGCVRVVVSKRWGE